MVAEERDDGGPEPRAERGTDLGRIGAHDGEVAVVDLELGLESGEVPDLARALRSPIAPVEAHDERESLGELREPDGSAGMVRQLEVGELSTGDEIRSHGLLLGRTDPVLPTSAYHATELVGVSHDRDGADARPTPRGQIDDSGRETI
jgi:hypothetical protein